MLAATAKVWYDTEFFETNWRSIMYKFTKPQLQTLHRLYVRQLKPTSEKQISYRQFRRTAFLAFRDCLMVPWCGMVMGIEKDGYAHS